MVNRKQETDEKSDLLNIASVFIVMLSYSFIQIFSAFVTGGSNISKWLTGFTFSIILLLVYRWLKKYLDNIGVLLLFVFLSFWLVPTLQYILYESNPKYYTISHNFKKNEALLAKELSKGQLSVKDLNKIITFFKNNTQLKKITIEGREGAVRWINLDSIKIMYVPEAIKFSYEKNYAINRGAYTLVFNKGDSLITTLKFKSDFPITWFNILVDEIEIERNKQQELLDMQTKFDHIPYSDFLIDSITAFSSGDISPSRNSTKILNGLQALLILFITTMVINSMSGGLVVKKKERRF